MLEGPHEYHRDGEIEQRDRRDVDRSRGTKRGDVSGQFVRSELSFRELRGVKRKGLRAGDRLGVKMSPGVPGFAPFVRLKPHPRR